LGGTTLGSVRTWLLERLDVALDAVPAYEDGRWLRYGDWGCRLTYRFPALRWWDNERR
jgi:hypothetical protein